MGRYKHGEGRRHSRSPEFSVWIGMRRRCLDPKFKSYPDYGGRGIAVCDRWRDSFENFLADMGRRPSASHTIERKNNDLGYSPDNCVWLPKADQPRNRRKRTRATHCNRGHELAGENVYLRPDGKRGCKACRHKNMADYHARKQANG